MGVEEVWEDIRRAKIDKWLKRGGAKPPAPKHGHGTTTFRVKNATYAKHGDSMGVIQHTQNKPPKPPRKYIGKRTVTNTANRSVWSPQPPAPGGKDALRVAQQNRMSAHQIKPIIRSTIRPGGGCVLKPGGVSSIYAHQQQVTGGLARTHRDVWHAHKMSSTAGRMTKHSAKLAKTAKIVKSANLIGLTITAAEGIYKGTKRALGPGGTEFHTKKSKNKYGTKGY